MRREFLIVLALCMAASLPACANLPYYAQSVNGHLNIVASGQPIDRLIKNERNPEELRSRLALARDIRQFATDQLALPDNQSYRNYVDTGRRFVSWAVFAAPELSLDIRTWCFPIMGCVPYRGYFSKDRAEAFADGLRNEGLDVHVGGIPAYSSLGLTSDPLLNTMLLYGEAYLAGVIFHELSHQRVYVQGDSAFNEAFAVAVERSGTEAWLKQTGKPELIRNQAAKDQREREFLAMIADTRDELAAIYSGDGSVAVKRSAKASAMERLKVRYERTKRIRWGGYKGFDSWFAKPVNNARIAAVGVYNDLVPAFTRLLENCGGYARFYQAVERLGTLDFQARRDALMKGNCG